MDCPAEEIDAPGVKSLPLPLDVFDRPGVAGNLAVVSLHSAQFLITNDTVSLILTQWYFSAIVAVVLLMPPCWPETCTLRAISYCRCGSLTTSLSRNINRSESSSSSLPSSAGSSL